MICAGFLQCLVKCLRVFAVHQYVESEIFMVRHQRTANFGIAQVRTGKNLAAFVALDLRIDVVRIFNHQIFITDFALPHGKTVANRFAKCDELFEYAVFRQDDMGKGRLKTGLIA